MSMQLQPGHQLLLTKFAVPQVPHLLMERPRLEALLDQSAQLKLSLISAPAGYGKTTTAARWLQSVERSNGARGRASEQHTEQITNSDYSTLQHPSAERSGWLSLEADDNDESRFWAYLLRALGDDFTALAELALQQLDHEMRHQPRQLLVALLNQLATSDRRYTLVLDDYHLITEPSIHQGMSFLLDHLPPTLHLVILTRDEPPLPLARLRARGQLLDIGAEQLRCTPGEATLFLRDVMSLNLPDATIAQLYERSEGWFAGLHLLGSALAACPDQGTMTATLAARPRFVVEYLDDDVLSQQPPEVQHFLISTAILDQFCGELADAVLQEDEGEKERYRLWRT